VVLVARSKPTTRHAAAAAVEQLWSDGAALLGIVLNDWDVRSSIYGYHGYYGRSYTNVYRNGIPNS